MKLKIFVWFTYFLLLILNISTVFATDVGGAIDTDTNWTLSNSPYRVIQSIKIREGVTLTIEPGVRIEFTQGVNDNQFNLTVDGQLIAQGTEEKRIVFTSSLLEPQAGDWNYILFSDTADGAVYDNNDTYHSGSILEYVTIEFAGANSNYGAIHLVNGVAPYINHGIIQYNKSSAMHYKAEKMIIDNTLFAHNFVVNHGGGIYFLNEYSSASALIVNNSVFNDNEAVKGGGIYYHNRSSSASLTLNNSRFSNNSSGNDGAGIYYLHDSNSSDSSELIVNNCYFTNNTSSDDGGGIYYYHSSSHPSSVIVNNSDFSANSAFDNGGGIYFFSNASLSSLSIHDSSFKSNSALDERAEGGTGGAVFAATRESFPILSSSLAMSKTLITKNYGIAALYLNVKDANINTSTIVNNYPKQGTAENTHNGIDAAPTGEIILSNNNIYGHGLYDMKNNSDSDISAINNYWGTSERSAIQMKLYDWYYDDKQGEIFFTPYLTGIAPGTHIASAVTVPSRMLLLQ